MSSSKSLTKPTAEIHQGRSLSGTAKAILSSDCCGISRCGYPEGSNAKCVMQERCRASQGLQGLTKPSDRERWQETNNSVIVALAEQLSLEPEWVSDMLYGMTLEKFQQLIGPNKSYWKGCKIPLVTCDSCDYYTMIFDANMNLIFPMEPNALMKLFELLRELDKKNKQPKDSGTSFLLGTIKKKKVLSCIGPDSVARENGLRRRFRNSFDLSGLRSLNNLMSPEDKKRVKNLYGSSDLQRKIARSSSMDLSHRAYGRHGLDSSPSREHSHSEENLKEHPDDHTHHRKQHRTNLSGASSRSHHTHRKIHGVNPSGASSRTHHRHHKSHGVNLSSESSRTHAHRKRHGVNPSSASSRTHASRKRHGLEPSGASGASSRYHYIYHHKGYDHSSHHRNLFDRPKQPQGLQANQARSVTGLHRSVSHLNRKEEPTDEYDQFMKRMQEIMDAKTANSSIAMSIRELQSIPMEMAKSEENSQSQLAKPKTKTNSKKPYHYYYGEQIPILAHKPFDPEKKETWIRRHPHAMRLADKDGTFVQDQPARRYKRPSVRLRLEEARKRYSVQSEYIDSNRPSQTSLGDRRRSPIQKYETPKKAKKS